MLTQTAMNKIESCAKMVESNVGTEMTLVASKNL